MFKLEPLPDDGAEFYCTVIDLMNVECRRPAIGLLSEETYQELKPYFTLMKSICDIHAKVLKEEYVNEELEA